MEITEIIKEAFIFPSQNLEKLAIYIVLTFVLALLAVFGVITALLGINDGSFYFVLTFIFLILGIIVALIITGYQVGVLKSGIDHDESAPNLELKNDFITGLKMLAVSIVYFIIPAIVGWIMVFITNIPGQIMDIVQKTAVSHANATAVAGSSSTVVTGVSDAAIASLAGSITVSALVTLVVFIIFGAFLERTGISNFFINLANCVAGASAGGPAKVAVISSALCGMVSGSSVGNTVTTGSVTIPMMKKTGYKGDFAGAVEAAASTGGQIMPPIMGAAAFLMAEYMGIPYAHVALKAVLPAILYFAGIYISVHLEAKKLGLRGIPKEELPKAKDLLPKIYLLLPLIVLVAMVSTNMYTMQFSATVAIGITILVGLINKDNRITPRKILEALAAGGQGTITVAAACGIAGIIAGTITMTGLANMMINGIVALAGNAKIVALFLTMICCIVLGMGVPTTANYCIMAATCAPILIRMGVPAVAAHFFVFYFGIVADLTPPVALAAYAGAAIAQANPMKTAFTSTKLAIGAFIVPYVFALNPAMLLVDTGVWEVVLICITSLVGIFGVSAALEGYLFHHMPWYERVLSAVGGLLLIYPGVVTDAIGLGLVAIVVLLQVITRKKYAKA